MPSLVTTTALCALILVCSACGGPGSPASSFLTVPIPAGPLPAPPAPAKVEICHHTGDGGWHPLVISPSALPAHLENHGDHLVGPEECDGIDNDCDGEMDEAGVCECPCDFSLPDPPLPFRNPQWECLHPFLGDTLHARLREKETPTRALWQAIVLEDGNDPDLHTCGTLTLDPDGRIVSYFSISGLDDAQAKGCVDWISDNAATVGIACVPN